MRQQPGRTSRQIRTLAALHEQVDTWNARCPIGTLVEYHPVIGARHFRPRVTVSKAWILSEHTAVVFLENETGCVALDACNPIPPEEPQP